MAETILQIKNLSKSFAGIKALDDVHLTIKKGEVHALMGENGAGKSTFMKILIGLLNPDSGEIIFEGNLIKNNTVSEISKKGISMIHQEILIIPELTVAQNIFLGREKEISGNKSGWLNDKNISTKATELLNVLGVDIDANVKMKYLSVAQMQMVEIAKAVSNNASVIIMDEPTSAISDKEVATLFKIIRDLKNKGVAIIYISHKMDEIFEICDTITVLRDGKYIVTKSTSELDINSLIGMMVGREINNMFPEPVFEKGKIALSVRNLIKKGKFDEINFDVQAGEIFGISGLMGAGRTEIALAIFGLSPADGGTISVNGQEVKIKSPQDAVANGIGYVSEDRKGLGFIPQLSVKQNLTLASLSEHRQGIFINNQKENVSADQMIVDLKIKASGRNQKVTHLSGGNQQKVVIGKVLAASPKVIILDEPTRGVDVGAKFEIYKLINNLAAQGMAVIMISSELPEILGMSDRIMVLSKGVQTATLSRKEATQELIMKYAVQ
ncbi:sugar ABC transporter ATP-binding protein [Dyadobacter subterraneus]|uniref:Sugar ABC transporter ATP-binding protein n=1 Tax=Dyadobacter subterraneus TaxID=2773304 RepID=A0ABR9WIM0_9BACT|nr:sugar ABC transporter ATP-binding protein [Dyadobacter subterraneus]MBE9464196.1 sugar ABC transporter ATP-binding protein [Dyadobacter subterraneus]